MIQCDDTCRRSRTLLEQMNVISYGQQNMNEKNQPLHLRVMSDEFARRKSKNPKYSLRAFSRFLKIAPTPLSEIIAGKRDISLKIADRIVNALKLDHSEKHLFLKSVAEAKQARGTLRIDARLKEILKDRSARYQERSLIGPEDFQVITDWYHLAIIEMTRLDDFRLDAQWIAERLSVQPALIQTALERLIRLGILCLENSRLVTKSLHYETSDKKKTSLAHRTHQKQLLEKSIQSVDKIPIEQRVHASICFAIDPSKIAEARMLCEELLDRMSDLLEKDGPKKEVYQFQVSLFPLTQTT